MKLIDKLPYFYDNPITKPIITSEQIESWTLHSEIQETLDQMFVETATWGLDWWEKMLQLPTIKTKTYEERRSIILARIRGSQTSTVKAIEKLGYSFFNVEKVEVEEHNDTYYFNLILENASFESTNFIDLLNALETYKPAHLNYVLTFQASSKVEINTNQRVALSILPECNTFYCGMWWQMYGDGQVYKSKVIKGLTHDGYSKLHPCAKKIWTTIYAQKNIYKSKLIQELTFTGYSKLNKCGIYKNKIKMAKTDFNNQNS